jgi:trehalose/maltose hydrolase-like predicted phosphorylase
MRLSVVRPIETRKFIAVSRQYLSTEQEAIDMWRDVVSSINLSDKQKLEIVQWKQLFMQKVEPIVEERKKLNVQIQSHLPQVSPAVVLRCSREQSCPPEQHYQQLDQQLCFSCLGYP